MTPEEFSAERADLMLLAGKVPVEVLVGRIAERFERSDIPMLLLFLRSRADWLAGQAHVYGGQLFSPPPPDDGDPVELAGLRDLIAQLERAEKAEDQR